MLINMVFSKYGECIKTLPRDKKKFDKEELKWQ